MGMDFAKEIVAKAIAATIDEVYNRTGEKSVLITHSQGGRAGWLVPQYTKNVAAIVAIEPGGGPAPDSAEYKKMRSQQLYCFEAPELMGSIIRANEICAKLSTMTFNSPEYRKIIEELIPGLPKTSAIVPPFHCDHGHGVVIGEHTFINYDCIMLDGGGITIGKVKMASSSSRPIKRMRASR